MSKPNFEAKVHQNQFLAKDAAEVHAIVSIKSITGGLSVAAPTARTVGLIADNSGSMDGAKIVAVRAALCAAIDLLPEDAYFFVVTGNIEGVVIVPLCQATQENKIRAKRICNGIKAVDKTFISRWLAKARDEFKKRPGIRQCLLLTDGKNDDEDSKAPEGKEKIAPLDEVLASCQGIFQCECRGLGSDYCPDQLRTIAGKLNGQVDMIKEASGLAADFKAVIEKTKGLAVADVFLQIWMPKDAELEFVKLVSPEIRDITSQGVRNPADKKSVGPKTWRFPTGAWGEESRDYHISVKVTPADVGKTMLTGRVSVIYVENGQEVEIKLPEGMVKATWTEDEAQSAVINEKVANYTGQTELAQKIQEGLTARQAGQDDKATKALQRAMDLAKETGNEGTKKLLGKVVDVAQDGTVRLKKDARQDDVVELDTRSTRTKRVS